MTAKIETVEVDKVGRISIKDSGERRTFSTGAVRDMQEGKGRCDLMPLYQAAVLLSLSLDGKQKQFSKALICLARAQECLNDGNDAEAKKYLNTSLMEFAVGCRWSLPEMLLEVSRQYEDGAKKYGEYNWQKGIPFNSYIDSSARHLLKHADNRFDERHDRAFVWNMLSLIWTIDNAEGLDG